MDLWGRPESSEIENGPYTKKNPVIETHGLSLYGVILDHEQRRMKIVNMMKYWVNERTRRYYRVHLSQDLLGDLTLTRSWGSLDSRLGRIQNELIPNVKQGRQILDEIGKLRARHGYIVSRG